MYCRFTIASFAVVLLASFSQGQPYTAKVGQRHADFTLANIHDGKPISLSDYRGKKVLLIHFASW